MANWLVKSYWSAFVLWNIRHEARLPYWPRDKVLGIQNRRVRSIVEHAWRYVPYYREVMLKARLRPEDFRRAEDLEQLPLIAKDELAHTPERFQSSYFKGRNGLTIDSSGTSGAALPIATNAGALFLALAHGHRNRLAMSAFVGRRFGYREAEIVRSTGVGAQMRGFFNTHSWNPPGIDLRRLTIDIDSPYEETRAALNRFRPDVVVSYGSWLGAYFRWMHEHHADFHRPKLLYYGGDRMPDADRLFLEQDLGIPVWSSYQASEALRLAFQCELRRGFHISLDQVAVRVLDRQGNRVGPGGTGECIVSNLINRATVILNLRIGDIVTLAANPCPCGRTLPCLERIEGRSDDLILRPDGSATHALGFLSRLQHVRGVAQIQVVQPEVHRILLRVVSAPRADWAETHCSLEHELAAIFGRDTAVTIERVERIPPEPGGKVRAVISHCRR